VTPDRSGATLVSTGCAEAIAMATRSVRCRLGLHAWVQRRAPEERVEGPDHQVCRVCGKERERNGPLHSVPPGFFSGGA
jgi:hypothetical protein